MHFRKCDFFPFLLRLTLIFSSSSAPPGQQLSGIERRRGGLPAAAPPFATTHAHLRVTSGARSERSDKWTEADGAPHRCCPCYFPSKSSKSPWESRTHFGLLLIKVCRARVFVFHVGGLARTFTTPVRRKPIACCTCASSSSAPSTISLTVSITFEAARGLPKSSRISSGGCKAVSCRCTSLQPGGQGSRVKLN